MINLRNSLVSFGFVLLLASCTNKSIPVQKENDDMYASSVDAAQSPVAALQKKNLPQSQTARPAVPYDDQYDPMDTQSEIESTDSYFDEDYISARDYKRKLSPNPGYSDGYSEGYSQGWTDYAWSQPMGWNSPFNRFNNNNIFFNNWSPVGMGVFVSYNPWGFNNWGMNRWGGFNNFGWNNWGNPWAFNSFYDPFWGNSFYSPWNNWYSPWGFNSFANNRWGMYDSWGYYGNSFNGYNPYYNNQSVLANRAYQTGQRTYGPRDNGGRNSTAYNDRFVNARRPVATMSGGRTASEVRNSGNTNNTTGQRTLSERRPSASNSGSTRSIYEGGKNQSSDAYDPNSRRSGSYDSYTRSNGGNTRTYNNTNSRSSGSSSNTYDRSSSNRSYDSGSSRSIGNSGYSRESSGSSGRSSGGSSNYGRSSSSGNYSSGSSRSSGYSSGGSNSGGGSSRGSSGGSSSSGSSSRGSSRN